MLLGGHPLESPATARCVRVAGGAKGGAVTVMDGPFAETKEILAGFFLLDCPTMDAAAEWTAKIPGSWYGTMELRPVAD